MPGHAKTALVLQGGGSLGAYELGVARRLYRDDGFAPVTVAGVSIGAITAVLLARPAQGLKPLQALEAFWEQVTVSGWYVPPLFQPFASIFGNRNFYMPRTDVYDFASWTYLYETAPLRKTLGNLVDTAALADRQARPKLLVSATDLEAGEITYFASDQKSLSIDHVIASGSLPPSFDMTRVGRRQYWDGGLFDNTPLGAVLDTFDRDDGAVPEVIVVNLFPNKAPVPKTMPEVFERMLNLQYANRTRGDLRLLDRFNDVAALIHELELLPKDHPLRESAAFRKVADQDYMMVPKVVNITRPQEAGTFDGSDFSAEAIARRAEEGFQCADRALG